MDAGLLRAGMTEKSSSSRRDRLLRHPGVIGFFVIPA
jgi:hypothetical protein